MKTLLERLKPEIKKNLLRDKELYPSLVGSILKSLESKVGITQLTLEDANAISNFSNESVVKIIDIYNMFDE